MKPALTDKQKDTFKKEFDTIIASAPDDIKKLYTGQIAWVVDIPHFSNGVHRKLTGELANKYHSLDLKLKNRTL